MRRHRTDLIVVHCSATGPDLDIGRLDIDMWHQERGWDGIGYHYVIRRSGAVEQGRDLYDIGAHVKGYNHVSVGICMVGGIDQNGDPVDNFTDAQFTSLAGILLSLTHTFPEAVILGHRDLSDDVDGDGVISEWEWMKECPCFDTAAWWLDWRDAHGLGEWPTV